MLRIWHDHQWAPGSWLYYSNLLPLNESQNIILENYRLNRLRWKHLTLKWHSRDENVSKVEVRDKSVSRECQNGMAAITSLLQHSEFNFKYICLLLLSYILNAFSKSIYHIYMLYYIANVIYEIFCDFSQRIFYMFCSKFLKLI